MASKGISVNLGGPRLLIRPELKCGFNGNAGTAEMLALNKLASFSLANLEASFLRSFSSLTKLVAKDKPSPTTFKRPVKKSLTPGKDPVVTSDWRVFFLIFS